VAANPQTQTKPTDLACEFAGSLLHPPLPLLSLEADNSLYRPMLSGRLSQTMHCGNGVQPVPKAVYCGGFHSKHNCPQ